MKKFLLCIILLVVIGVSLPTQRPVAANDILLYGLTSDEVNFYQQFWGPLVDMPQEDYIQLSYQEQKTILRQSLQTQYTHKKYLIAGLFPELTAEQRFLAFLMLRVNGSMPVYAQNTPARTLSEIIYNQSGSCNAYSLRFVFVLRLFGLHGTIAGFAPPSMPGHVVVEMHDGQNALIVDANSNTLIVYPETTQSFFDVIRGKTMEDITQYTRVYKFPYYEQAFLPSTEYVQSAGFNEQENNPEYRNTVYTPRLKNNWLTIFTTERDSLLASLVTRSDQDLASDRFIASYAEFWNL